MRGGGKEWVGDKYDHMQGGEWKVWSGRCGVEGGEWKVGRRRSKPTVILLN